jgi:fimbrial isopeptide formation D2 family protein/LPXTG-motif cell wall-anchored protein
MKGKIRKLLSVVVATAMTLSCLSVPALADTVQPDKATFTVKSTENFRSYDLIQLFKGTYSEVSGKKVLSNIQWGANFAGTDAQKKLIVGLASDELPDGSTNPVAANFASLVSSVDGALQAKTGYTAESIAEAIANAGAEEDSQAADAIAAVVAKYAQTPAYATINGTTTKQSDGIWEYHFGEVDAGYYVLNETTDNKLMSKEDGTIYQYSRYILKVVGQSFIVNSKEDSTSPSIDKKIVNSDDSTSQYSAASIGDTVNYKISAKVPDTSRYTKYYYVITDTLSAGLTLNDTGNTGFTVTIGDKTLVRDADYTVKFPTTPANTFRIVFKNFTQWSQNSDIVITYSATLNENAVVGKTGGNTNSAKLTYSNNPNAEYKGITSDPDDPGDTPSEDGVVTTKDSTTYTYTTGLELYKVDSKSNRLQGASFKIEATSGLNKVITSTDSFEAVQYYTSDLDESTDYWYESNAGVFYNKAPGKMTDKEKSDLKSSVIRYTEAQDGTTSVTGPLVYNAGSGEYETWLADKTYNLDSDKSPYYNSGYIAYKKIETKTTITSEEAATNSYAGTVGENGELEFNGISEGTYTITETEAPTGYNKLSTPIEIKVTWTAPTTEGADCSWNFEIVNNSISSQKIASVDTGKIRLDIVNKAGSSLPETGGIGTTIFYVAGTILVLGAAVALITRRRMKGEVK